MKRMILYPDRIELRTDVYTFEQMGRIIGYITPVAESFVVCENIILIYGSKDVLYDVLSMLNEFI